MMCLHLASPHPRLFSTPSVGSRPPVAFRRAHLYPLPRYLQPHSPYLELKSCGCLGLGVQLRGSKVFWGDKNPSCSPSSPRENQLGREGFSSCTPASRGPRLASRVPQRRSAFSLTKGEARRKTPNQSGRGEEGAKTSLRGLRSSAPLPKVRGCWSQKPSPGAGSSSSLGPASSGGGERAQPAIFGPNRHAPHIQAGGAGLEH